MSYSILSSSDAVPYQNPAPYPIEQLAALEDVCAPYLRAGYKITSQSAGSFVLARPRSGVSLLAVLLLLCVPPLLILYLIVARNRRDEVVCVRVNSRGMVEETGDTLAAVRADARQSAIAVLVVLAIIVAVVGYLLFSNRSASTTPASVPRSDATYPVYTYPQPTGAATRTPARRAKAADAPHPYIASVPDDPYRPYEYPPDDSSPEVKPSAVASIVPAAPVEPKAIAPKKMKTEPARLVEEGDVLFPAKAATAAIYRKSEVDAPAALLDRPEPAFTAEGARTSGTVRLEAVLRPDGTVTDIKVVKGLPHGLTWAAVQAARAITFTPAYKDGAPVPVKITLAYNFSTN